MYIVNVDTVYTHVFDKEESDFSDPYDKFPIEPTTREITADIRPLKCYNFVLLQATDATADIRLHHHNKQCPISNSTHTTVIRFHITATTSNSIT